MKLNKLFAFPAIAATISLAACGGGSSAPAPLPTTAPTSKPVQNNAKSSITFRIPLGSLSGVSAPASRVRSTRLHPMFIDGNSNGDLSVYFDGTAMISNVSFASVTGTGAGPSGSGTLPNGGSYSYTSTIAYGNGTDGPTNQLYATVTGSYATIPGSHTIGAVQTNGVCNVGTDPCLANNAGYVLAEGQTTVNLTSGDNGNTALYLKGVMESAYFLSTASTAGSTTFDVVVADENGTAIPHQLEADNTTVLPFDNGSYQIVETDSNNIVTIAQPGSTYAVPGTSRHGLYGESVTVTCANAGTTTVAAELVAPNTPSQSVSGFTYTAQNYPQAGSILGSVGSDEYYGGAVSINCNASGTLTIQ